MSLFTVTLVRPFASHNYSHVFDQEEFIREFPGSLFELVLSNTPDNIIPIDQPMVTPEVLQLLSTILAMRDYPYIPDSMKKPLDYLGIDIPNVVYDPKYDHFRTAHPLFNLKTGLSNAYGEILTNGFPELLRHLLGSTESRDEDEFKWVQSALYGHRYSSEEEQMLLCLLQGRPEILRKILTNPIHTTWCQSIHPLMTEYFTQVAKRGYVHLFDWLMKNLRQIRYNVVYGSHVLRSIRADPEHIQEYIEMLQYLNDLPKDRVEPNDRHLITTAIGLHTGTLETPLPKSIFKDLNIDTGYTLALICVGVGQYDLFHTIFQELDDHPDRNTVPSPAVQFFEDIIHCTFLTRDGLIAMSNYMNTGQIRKYAQKLRAYRSWDLGNLLEAQLN